LGCRLPGFDPHGQRHECDAWIGAGQPADLTLYLRSPVPIAGLQGELDFLGDPALHITRLAPTGAAAGMLLRWPATPHGARFALVADQGASVPPTPAGEPAPAVLAIDVELGTAPPPPVTILGLTQFAVADTAGRELVCPTLVVPAPIVARICSGSGPAGRCDFNGDGREDIRDLVLMVRCLRDSALCGDSAARFDCNQEGGFTLDDV